jgi:hypothetical protein
VEYVQRLEAMEKDNQAAVAKLQSSLSAVI